MRTIILIVLLLISTELSNSVPNNEVALKTEEVSIKSCFNNNPFNLRGNDKWLGRIESDNSYIKFESMEYGIRAGLINLQNQTKIHGIKSVKKLIEKYAPSFENNTEKYVYLVTSYLGKDEIDLTNKEDLINISSVISQVEGNVLRDEEIEFIYNKFLN